MKVVGLISGGKDSLYNLMHCKSNGHEIIALANLRPSQGVHELDSYMYQSVGSNMTDFIAQAMELPLFQREITGKAIIQTLQYTQQGGDETEDLFELLSEVKRRHPDLEAVSSGAILSDYQRIRVESVCARLGLVSLTYLWRWDQGQLMRSMIADGLHAVLFKVAGMGLKPRHLGKSLAEMEPTLLDLNEKFQLHICGEGGEYETITLDCPLFKKRIVLTETAIHTSSDSSDVGYLVVTKAELHDKSAFSKTFTVKRPGMLDEYGLDLLHGHGTLRASRSEASGDLKHLLKSCQTKSLASGKCARRACVATSVKLEPSEAVHDLFKQLKLPFGKKITDAGFINLYVCPEFMDQFSKINEAYNMYFGSQPPSRACVAVSLFGEVKACIDVMFCDTALRKTVHVTSRSYWAPANIGPYSQYCLIDHIFYTSGQIGMRQETLDLPVEENMQCALALQHANRIAEIEPSKLQLLPSIIWMTDKEQMSAFARMSQADVFLIAEKLPKGAVLEIQSLKCVPRLVHSGEYPDDDLSEEQIFQTEVSLPEGTLYQGSGSGVISVILFGEDALPNFWKSVDHNRLASVRIYYSDLSFEAKNAEYLKLMLRVPIVLIPVKDIFGKDQKQTSVALLAEFT